jgi:hypothetical protein
MTKLSSLTSAIGALGLLTLCGASPSYSATIEMANAGRVTALDSAETQPRVQYWLQQLMLSTLVRDVIQASSIAEWQHELLSASRIHLRYGHTVTLAIPERRALTFSEVLLPLPSDHYPDYVYIKRGRQVLRLAKYDPWVLHKLVSEAGLSLYEQLANVERGLF